MTNMIDSTDDSIYDPYIIDSTDHAHDSEDRIKYNLNW